MAQFSSEQQEESSTKGSWMTTRQLFRDLASQLTEEADIDEHTCSGRGGSTICTVGEKVVIFGGVNRQQIHFSDCSVIESATLDSPTSVEKIARLVSMLIHCHFTS